MVLSPLYPHCILTVSLQREVSVESIGGGRWWVAAEGGGGRRRVAEAAEGGRGWKMNNQ